MVWIKCVYPYATCDNATENIMQVNVEGFRVIINSKIKQTKCDKKLSRCRLSHIGKRTLTFKLKCAYKALLFCLGVYFYFTN